MNSRLRRDLILSNSKITNKLRLKRRHLRISTDIFDIPESSFVELFRLPKTVYNEVFHELTPFMNSGKTNTRLPPKLRFLVALRFFAQGSYQSSVGQDFFLNVSQSCVSRCIREIIEIFDRRLLAEYVRFLLTIGEILTVKTSFYEKFCFPGIVGVIDGSHIKIKGPDRDIEHVYVCRKGGHSINLQIVCDYNLRILDCNSRFGGTAHDASVWRANSLKFYYRTSIQMEIAISGC